MLKTIVCPRSAGLLLFIALSVLLAFKALNPAPALADGLVVIECPPPCDGCLPPVITPLPHQLRLTFDSTPFAPPFPRPRPRPDCENYLSVKNHNVTVTIDHQLARTQVDETFVNQSDLSLEGTYIFPLPDDAAISEFSMYVDGVKVEGKVLDRYQARQIYEDIVRRRRDPALLEYIGRSSFQAHIFPIPPHGEKRVEISYAQVLQNDNGLVRYVYPLNTEKFSPDPIGNVSINLAITSTVALKAIYSPSHQVSIARADDYHATIGYEASNVKPDHDFVLYYSLSSDAIGATLLSYKPDALTDGFFVLLLTPQVNVADEMVTAKDVVLVLDTSGSMQGIKIDQARRALKFVLDRLGPDDRFNVISFSTGLDSYAAGLQPMSLTGDAKAFVDRLVAGGSTDINRPLLEALSELRPGASVGNRPGFVIFLTDGLPTAGETNTQKIIENVQLAAPSNVRLFTFGVGDDVNTLLLDSLSEQLRGASAYVRPSESIDEAVSAFYGKVSKPVLSDLKIDWGGASVYDSYPYALPDLFAGSQMLIAGRYKQPMTSTITLSGDLNGSAQQFRFYNLGFVESGGDEFIAPLWATRKIGYLLSQIRLHGENSESVDEIVALAVRYGIVTPYTSFLIDEQNDVFTPEGLGGAAQDLRRQLAPAAAPTSGPTAVAQSQVNRALKDADSSIGEPSDQVRLVGDKAFVLRAQVWTDTTFDPTNMTTTKVPFGSDQFYEWLAQHPDWAPFLSLGQRVIFVVGGIAFEVT